MNSPWTATPTQRIRPRVPPGSVGRYKERIPSLLESWRPGARQAAFSKWTQNTAQIDIVAKLGGLAKRCRRSLCRPHIMNPDSGSVDSVLIDLRTGCHLQVCRYGGGNDHVVQSIIRRLTTPDF